MTRPELTVIIPTFNEEQNIGPMAEALQEMFRASGIAGEILVVDDSSTDRTIEIATGLAETYPNVRLMVRENDHGLSQSVAEGFEHARGEIIQVIDADFSHPPALIPEFVRTIREGSDVVVGSRYMKGGGIEQWPLKRRIISLGATGLGRVLFPDITDPVSGFFAIRKEVVEDAPLKPRGYKILMEVLGKGRWTSAREIPFTFRDREEGESKLRPRTMIEYIQQVLDICVFSLTHGDSPVWHEWKKMLKFSAVGISGIFVNMGLLYILTDIAGLYYLYSALVAIEVSIINNFIWNDLWTFRSSRGLRLGRKVHRFVSFQAVSIGGLLINMCVLYLLTDFAGIYYLISNLVGIFAAFIWNYFINRHFTWKNI
ncbi:MAG: glycosyltransferase [Methanomicrobiales archaeon]